MQELTIILVSITLIQLWVDWIDSFPLEFVKRLRYGLLDRKPFNCTLCISVWLGIIISVITLNPLYLALPLFNKLTEKTIY
jgi:hypothetical protein